MKRAISLILTMVMLIGMLPVFAAAEECPVMEDHVHSWGDWVVTQESTVESEGIQERICTVCTEKETETLEKLPQPEQGTMTSIEIAAETDCIAPGETVQLVAAGLPEDAIDKNVTWFSQDESVLMVDENAETTLNLSQLQQKYQSGEYWNHYVSNYKESGNYQLDNKLETFAENLTSTKCWNHNLEGNYESFVGHYDWTGFDGAAQCMGFARLMGYKAFGTRVSTWPTTTKLEELKPGDVVWYSGFDADPQYGHTVFVTDVSGTTITVGECNVGGKPCMIQWGRTINLANVSSYKIYSAPHTLSVNPDPVLSPEDYLKYYAEKVGTHFAVAYPMNGASITAWKLPWTNSNDSTLKLATVSGNIRIIKVIQNHAGNIWYEYETGTDARGFVYSSDLLFRAKTLITLDPNGGSVSRSTMSVDAGYPYGDIPEGDLPIPSRSGYNFQGWFTNKTDGTKVTKNTIVANSADHTLYAHWNPSTVAPPYCSDISHSGVTTDNAYIKINWKNPSAIKLIQAGICISTNPNVFESGTKYTDDVPVSYQTAETLPCSYDLKNEYGIKLTSGTTYFYAFFAIDSNDNVYTNENDVRSFTTTASFPYHSDVSIGSITADNAFIKATVNNPSAIKLVTAGFYISTSPNAAETGTKYTDTVHSAYQTAATIPCTHDLKNEYGITLQSGTKYYVVLYVADSSGMEYPIARTEYTFTTIKVPVSSVSISTGGSTINIGSTLKLEASVLPANATIKSVSWSSSDLAVASVSAEGVVTAKGKGTATITATAKDGSGKSAAVIITVTCSHSSGYIIEPVVPATCTQIGLTEGKRCCACNEVILKQTEIPALGHNNSYAVTNAPTSTATGVLTGTCSRCSDTNLVTLPQLNINDYTYSEIKAATCTVEGSGRYIWNTTTYGSFYFDVTIGTTEHSYSAMVIEPTCTDGGYTILTCSTCNDSYVNDYVDTTGHAEVIDPAIAATCTTAGNTEGKHCSECGEVLIAQEEIPALGHSYENGSCTVCGEADPNYSTAVKIASGWSGDLTWVLTDDGVLTFSGTGAMKNYGYKSEMPWYKYIDQITSVVINEGATRIGDYAFYGMTKLETIDIADTVTYIGDFSFKGSTALDGVVLPPNLSNLGDSAFYGCTGLTAIEIPASLYTVKPYSFKYCSSLAKVTFHEGNLMKLSDGSFYGTALTEVEFPKCLDIIDVYCFKNCFQLASITIPEGDLTQIREAVFYATAIPSIAIPEGVTKVGPYAFKNCVNLNTVSLPTTLTSVGEASFYACIGLQGITIPDAVTSIGNYAFRKCAAMTEVNLGRELTDIGESSFYGCTGLTSLEIPDKVTTIQGYAFKGCTGLTDVTLGSSVETLGESAFHTCTALKTLELPASLKTIGDYCFSGSYNLWQLTFTGNAPSIGSGAFKSMAATACYPANDSTWTSAVMQNYGGSITWKAVG